MREQTTEVPEKAEKTASAKALWEKFDLRVWDGVR